jgi:hypothetical protein
MSLYIASCRRENARESNSNRTFLGSLVSVKVKYGFTIVVIPKEPRHLKLMMLSLYILNN